MAAAEEEDKEDVLKNISDWFLLLAGSCMAALTGVERLAQSCPDANGAKDSRSLSEM